jgi:transcriptional regulator with XRE-family HTH domain
MAASSPLSADPSHLLVEARRRAGLSQRELAERAQTSQSVVARIESGKVSPSWGTLARLLAATGCEIHAQLREVTDDLVDLDDTARILSLTPEERLVELRNASRFFAAARRVG